MVYDNWKFYHIKNNLQLFDQSTNKERTRDIFMAKFARKRPWPPERM